MKATVIRPFGSDKIIPLFDYGARVTATKQPNGLYTVTREGHEANNANTIMDVPEKALRFEGEKQESAQ